MFDLNRTNLVAVTGAAWLSSACAGRGTVNSGNMRNPHLELIFLKKLLWITKRKVGMTSNQHGPYALGYTRATMATTMGLPSRKTELIPSKVVPVRIEGCNSPS